MAAPAPAPSALADLEFALPCDIPVHPGTPCPHAAEFTADFHDCSTGFRQILISRQCLKDILTRVHGRRTHCTSCMRNMSGASDWIKNVHPIRSTP